MEGNSSNYLFLDRVSGSSQYLFQRKNSMFRQFKQILLAFYKIATKSRQLGDLQQQALERYLSFCEIQAQKPKDKRQKDLEDVRSRISNTSSLSNDSYSKIRQLYRTDSLIKASLFVFFLHMVKTNKIDKLNMIFKNASDLLRKYDSHFRPQERKKFLTKMITFNEELLLLTSKINNRGKIDWVYHESFAAFQEQCLLFAQIMSSFGEGIETIDNIKKNDYCNFLVAMSIQCLVVDYQKKTCLDMGGGDVKVYLGKKAENYCILSEKQYERSSILYRKEQRESNESKGQQDLKKYQSSKFKEQFLSEMVKLKQQYERNTARIASLFNFKDGGAEDEKWAEEMRHI